MQFFRTFDQTKRLSLIAMKIVNYTAIIDVNY